MEEGKVVLLTTIWVQELELLESKSAGLKTKAETQAKYGW